MLRRNARSLAASCAVMALASSVLAGCAATSTRDDWPAPAPLPAPPPAVANGAIYQANRDIRLFENTTAHRIGDLITVRLLERTSATKSATTSTSKKTDVSIPGPTIAGRPVTVNGIPILETQISGEHAFDGQGDSSQSNRLDGYITVTVVGQMPNGNLVVRGQKWLMLNQGKEFIRVEGVVRAVDIEPDNSVPSWKIADARIGYGGRGALNESNSMGWLARFFNSPLMPF